MVTGQGAQKGVPGTCPVAGTVEEVLEDKTEASADTGGHKGICAIFGIPQYIFYPIQSNFIC